MLELEALRQQAMVDTGLEDFGDPAFYEALERLLEALHTEARLNEFGHMRAEMTILDGLSRRLEIENYLTSHPEVGEQQVQRPVFILGLPRTGTTALHHLLNQDPRNRTLRLWEAQQPVPPPETASYTSDPRIAARAEG
ncbi:MAG TPA: sulfotransferase, partial [Halieaceae bacterium]|nr:sulfotransferase [Halieaceae bacterium]